VRQHVLRPEEDAAEEREEGCVVATV
jgi:hypothetical protein